MAEDVDSEVKIVLEAIEAAGYGAELVEIKPRNPGSQSHRTEADDVWKVTYAIEGMTCSACVANISNPVNELECVKSVTTST